MRSRLYYAVFMSTLALSSLFMISTSLPHVQAATNWSYIAQVAWRYFQPGVAVSATTGLQYGTLDWHYITDWDVGNYLLAILDAQAIGLIPKTGTWGADYRLNKVLSYLQTRTLRSSDGLPYWAYQSDTGSPATDQSRLVTDVADSGRLLVALYVVETKRPDLASTVDSILNRVTPTGATLRQVYNTNFIQGKTYSGLYEYYFTLGFKLFGFDVTSSTNAWNNIKTGPMVNVYGQTLPRMGIVSEIFLNGLLEIPTIVDSTFADYAYRTLLAQQGRYQSTGKLTGWTEGASDCGAMNGGSPYPGCSGSFYLYEWIVRSDGSTWVLDDRGGGPPAGYPPIMYTKVACGMNALFPANTYAQTLMNSVLGKVETQSYGFREGIRESDGSVIGTPTWPIQDKTNSLCLASARHALADLVPTAGSLHVTTAPSISVQMTWNTTNTGITTFSIDHSAPFTITSLTAPTSAMVGAVTYRFNHWELDGVDLGTSNIISSVSIGGSQPGDRTATAYYLTNVPLSGTLTPIFGAPAGTVYYIGNTNPYDNQALVGIWAKSTNLQLIGLQTNPAWVDQTTGAPLVAGNLVVVAGPIANKLVKYYATQGMTPGFRFAPVSGVSYAQIVLGNHVVAQMKESDIGTGKDLFIVHSFRDGSRQVLVIWGIGAQGTLASGIWLVSNFSTFNTLSNGLYVYQWVDGANGGSVDGFPQPAEITLLSTG